jgi:hypothetical protein
VPVLRMSDLIPSHRSQFVDASPRRLSTPAEDFEGEMTIASITRQALEDSWRLRLEETQVRYREATEQYRKLLQAQSDGRPLNPDGALALARHAESQALADYMRVLQIFTELTVNGKMPQTRSVAGSSDL